MADETHKLQKDPPEGSRKVVDQELERRSGDAGKGGAQKAGAGQAPTGGGKGEAGSKRGR